ncbi:hypothetical protein L2E82_49933 [Cichorium intybus]|nr:hypothetical protein L2E82_49933 [Cichorium intybus]
MFHRIKNSKNVLGNLSSFQLSGWVIEVEPAIEKRKLKVGMKWLSDGWSKVEIEVEPAIASSIANLESSSIANLDAN